MYINYLTIIIIIFYFIIDGAYCGLNNGGSDAITTGYTRVEVRQGTDAAEIDTSLISVFAFGFN